MGIPVVRSRYFYQNDILNNTYESEKGELNSMSYANIRFIRFLNLNLSRLDTPNILKTMPNINNIYNVYVRHFNFYYLYTSNKWIFINGFFRIDCFCD